MSIKAIQEANLKHPRIVFFMETEEESGSEYLQYWLTKLKEEIGTVSQLYCLDSIITD